jgi:RNA polymerase sigma factor (sigma-70 family)
MKATAAEQTGMKQQDFEALFSKYRQVVYLAAKSVTGNKRDAEDALQSLFLKLIEQAFREDSVRDPAGYLYRAAANEARQMYRARERRTRNHTDDNLELVRDPQSNRSRGEEAMRDRLLDAMAKLEPEQADILLLWFERGYSDAEIAGLLGKTRGAVAMALHRAKERLKELMCHERSECQPDRAQPLIDNDSEEGENQ